MTNSYRGLSAPPGGTIRIPPVVQPQTFLQRFLSFPKRFLSSPTDSSTEGFKFGEFALGGSSDQRPAGGLKLGGFIDPVALAYKKAKDSSTEFDMKDFQENFNKQNEKYLNQAYLFGGFQNAANSIQKGAAYYPAMTQAMMNQTVGTLASLSQGQKALAATLAAPVTPIQRMGYYG